MAELHTLTRIYAQNQLRNGISISLDEKQGHYIGTVLRLQNDDQVRIFNGIDGEWLGHIYSVKSGKKRENPINIVLDQKLRDQTIEPDLWLCCAPIKKSHFDFTIMKATELGVAHIQPILTARTQVRDVNLDRLLSIAIEAAEQSERLNIPQISAPITLEQLIKQWPSSRTPLICAEAGKASPINEALVKNKPHCPAIVVGPEGGFELNELEKLCALPGAVALRLGPRILRADTAAISALSCWQSVCGDWK